MPIRVLVIDDEEAIRVNAAAFLEDEGMQVAVAESGEDAVNTVENDPDIDVCIVDMRLVGMDGNATILAIHEMRPDMEFIIHTGSANYVLPPTLRAIGLSNKDVFMKPLEDMFPLAKAVAYRASRKKQNRYDD